MKIVCALVVGMVLVLCGICQAQQTAPPANNPPPYTLSRFDEDYRYLRDPAEGEPRDFFDAIKYIRFTDKGDIYLSLGGQAATATSTSTTTSAGPQDMMAIT
jgi:hypothetical protein